MQKSIKKALIPFAVLAAGLASCSFFKTATTDGGESTSYTVNSNETENTGDTSGTSVDVTTVGSTAVASSDYTNTEASGTITLAQGASATDVASGVTIDNANNIVTITSFGTYVITGSLTNGTLKVETPLDTEGDVELDLNGVSITKSGSATLAPLVSVNDAKVKIKRVEGTTSVITDKRTSDTGDDSSAIFSNKKLSIVGSGSLKVISTYNNGVASDTHVKIKNGAISISCPNHCVKAHKSVVLGDATDAGSFTFDSTGTDGGGVRVDEVEAVATPVYGLSTEDDDINGIEIKTGGFAITSVGKGLSSAGYLYMEGGNGTITSSKDKGIKADYNVVVDGGDFTVKTPVDDCIHSSSANVVCNGGTYVLTSGTTDGCQGLKGENYVYVNGGYFKITASYEGIAAHKIQMNGGTTIVTSSDDGWSAGGTNESDSTACSIEINGGFHYVYASGDGIDSNGNLTITGGTTVVSAPSSGGNGPLDYGESVGTFTQSGGTIVAYGTAGMATGASTGTQNSVLLASHTSITSGTYYVFTVGSSYYAVKTTRASGTVYASFPGYSNNSYNIYSASSVTIASTVFEAGNLYTVSAYSSSSTLVSGTFSSATSQHVSSGSSSHGGPGGGGPGGGF